MLNVVDKLFECEKFLDRFGVDLQPSIMDYRDVEWLNIAFLKRHRKTDDYKYEIHIYDKNAERFSCLFYFDFDTDRLVLENGTYFISCVHGSMFDGLYLFSEANLTQRSIYGLKPFDMFVENDYCMRHSINGLHKEYILKFLE